MSTLHLEHLEHLVHLEHLKPIVDFTARGPARAVSSAIETYAAERRVVSALVVPWESEAGALSMAVTSTTRDGWAIEHTNLGTITLADLGDNCTRVAVISHEPDHSSADQAHPSRPDQAARAKRAAVLAAFARQIEQRFGTTAQPAAEPSR